MGHSLLRIYQMNLKIAVLAGDGIGPEVTREAPTSCALSLSLRLTTSASSAADRRHRHHRAGSPLHRTIDAALECDAVLNGPSATTSSTRSRPTSVRGRAAADPPGPRRLCNCAPRSPTPRSRPTPRCAPRSRGVNILFVRELLGGLYFGGPAPGTARPAWR